MWCVFDGSFEFVCCIASFKDEAKAIRFCQEFLKANPDYCEDWVWYRWVEDVPADYPEFVDAQCGVPWNF